MAIRLYGIGVSPQTEKTYRASIYDADFSGTATTFEVSKGGITINWGTSKKEDRHAPIFGSVAAVKMLVPVGDSTLETFLEDLRTSKEGRFFLEITNHTDTIVEWRGVIVADNSWETDQAAIFEANIAAVDGIALLKKTPYYDTTGPALYTSSQRLTHHITKVLSKLTHASLWGSGDIILETSVDWWAVGMTAGGANDALHLTYVDNAAFYDYHTKGSIDDDVLSCYDVLVNIMIAFGCRIVQKSAVYRVEQIDYRYNSTYETRSYSKAGTFISNSTRSGLNNITQAATGAKLSYVTFDYIPQIGKAKVSYEAKLRRNFWGNILLSQGATFNFDQEISSNSGATTLRLRGNFMVSVKNNSYSGNPQDILFTEMAMFLKVGNNYLNRDGTYQNFAFFPGTASWSTSALNLVKIVSSGQQVQPVGLSQTFIFSFDFITPPLIGDGSDNAVAVSFSQLKRNNNESVTSAQFTISWTAGSMWMETYDLGTPDVQEDEILYISENDDEGAEVWEATTRLGSGTGANYAGRLMNSSNVNMPLWGAGVAARDKNIGTLLADKVLAGQLRAIKRMSGQLYGDLDPMKALNTSDSIRWVPMQIEWSPTDNIVSGTWFESDYGTTFHTATPIKKKYVPMLGGGGHPYTDPPQGNGFSGNGNSNFANNSPGTVLAPISFNNLGTVITEGGTITSIGLLVPSTGNDFLAGDGVTLCHPTSGKYQTFTIATAPIAGATSLSVTSVAAEFDAPIGSFLVVKQKPYSFSLPTATLGQILRYNGTAWVAFSGTNGEFLKWVTGSGWISAAVSGGSGTVTSVGLSLPAIFSVSGSPVTTSGTLTAALATQLANLIWAGPVSGGAATPTFRAMVTADIPNDTVTYAKLQNISATLRVLGRIAAGAGDAEELTAANLYTIMSLLNGAADQIAFFTGANGMSSNAGLKWLQASSQLSVEGGAGVPWFVGASGASIAGSVVLMGMSRNISGDLQSYMKNTRNLSNTGTVTQVYSVGGSAAGNITILFEVLATKSLAMGIHNTAVGDPFRITPNSTTVGGVANAGLTLTQDAVPLFGVNKDAPVYPLDVSGRARASQYIGVGGAWGAGNIAFAGGAGTGPVLNSIAGPINAFTITFTTGTAPTANATIFNATYPTTFPAVAVPVFSARSFTSAADLNKFYLSANNASGFTFQATGTLTASTQYAFTFSIFGS